MFSKLISRLVFYKKYFKKSPVKILFRLKYGVGDKLFALVWLQEFKKYFADIAMEIHAYYISDKADKNLDVLLYKRNLFTEISRKSKKQILKSMRNYDIVIDAYDAAVVRESSRLKVFPKLYDYIEKYKKNEKKSRYEQVACSVMLGKHRIHKADLNDFLNISDKSMFEIHLPDNKNLLSDLGLAENQFITIARSIDVSHTITESTKLWPIGHYENLVRQIKKEFPSYKIVQLGPAIQKCVSIDGVDINLLGRTSFEQLLILLKSSFLHIDCEGGLVHLRHFLGAGNKKSIVMFGPTPKEYFGWPENINISAQNACKSYCVYLLSGLEWQYKCMRGFDIGKHPCMQEIKPEFLMNHIREIINQNVLL
jgi:ADP-heptose:LPS heptosyltransferase